MKANRIVMVASALALALLIAVALAASAQAGRAAPEGDSFEEWLAKHATQMLDIQESHPVTVVGLERHLVPTGELQTAEYCVGDFCSDITLQRFEGPHAGIGIPDLRWLTWVCFQWAGAPNVECLVVG